MVTLQQVSVMARALPGVEEGERQGLLTWAVGGRAFAWERAFSKADVRRFGDAGPPGGDIVAVRTGDLEEKDAVLAAGLAGVFTIPHFDGYAAVLVQLRRTTTSALREVLIDGWLACAPPGLAQLHAADLAGVGVTDGIRRRS